MGGPSHNGHDPDSDVVARFEPDYTTECVNCGQTPTVTGVDADGNVRVAFDMCGPCTFGTAAALDPDWWNNAEE